MEAPSHPRIATLSLAALGLLLLVGCAGAERRHEQQQPPPLERFRLPMMGTVIEVAAPRGPAAEAAARIVFDTFSEVDQRMSEWKVDSPLTAVNQAAGQAAREVPEDVLALVQRGLELGRMTDGAFDLSWAALWGLWDFGAEIPVVPAPEAIAERVARVDYRRVEVDAAARTVRLPEVGMALGVGGIAKGWALDLAAHRLREAGHTDFLVSAGGQVMAGGRNLGGPWTVGLRDPRGAPDDAFAAIDLAPAPGEAQSVSTSGDYERFFMAGGVRYHHILDPRTGMPARGLRAVTVVSRDATLADALSTAIMVLGREEGLALVERLPAAEALLVDDQGTVHLSTGMGRELRLLHSPAP